MNSTASEIDRVLTDCITFVGLRSLLLLISFAHHVRQARPVYLTLSTDQIHNKIPRGRLDTPLKLDPPMNDPLTEEFVLGQIQTLVEAAGSEVVILVDACAIRYDVTGET